MRQTFITLMHVSKELRQRKDEVVFFYFTEVLLSELFDADKQLIHLL